MAEKVLDVAMESTSQEILAKIESTSEESKPLELFGGGTINAGTGTALEITGKGELFNVNMNSTMLSSTGYGILKVEIDGEVVFWLKGYNANDTTETLDIFFGDIKSPNIFAKYSAYGAFVNGLTGQGGLIYPYANSSSTYHMVKPSAEMQNYTASANKGLSVTCLLTKPIKFNESLKITYDATGLNNATDIVGAYTLDEE